MLDVLFPRSDRFHVLPGRDRDIAARLVDVFEALDRHEALNFLDFVPELRGKFEVPVLSAGIRLELEDYDHHWLASRP